MVHYLLTFVKSLLQVCILANMINSNEKLINWIKIWYTEMLCSCFTNGFDLIWFLVFNATFSNISALSWRPVLHSQKWWVLCSFAYLRWRRLDVCNFLMIYIDDIIHNCMCVIFWTWKWYIESSWIKWNKN